MIFKSSQFQHAPGSNLDYGFDWTCWLSSGETITVSVWVVDAGMVKTDEEITGGITSLFLSGGVAGITYDAVNTITTSAPGNKTRTDSRTLKLYCIDR